MAENERSLNASDDMFDDSEIEENHQLTDMADINLIDSFVASNSQNKQAPSDINYCSYDDAAENSLKEGTKIEQKIIERDFAPNNEVNKRGEISDTNPHLDQRTILNKTTETYGVSNGNNVNDQTHLGFHRGESLNSEHSQFNESNSQDMETSDESLSDPFVHKKDTLSSSDLPARPQPDKPKGDTAFKSQDSQAAVESQITCPFCNSPQRSLSTLEIHIELSHPENSNVDMDDGAAPRWDGSDNYCFLGVCPYCDIDLGDEVTLQVHINAMHDNNLPDRGTSTFSCPLCESVTSTEQDMKVHLEAHSNDSTVYGIGSYADVAPAMTCPVCRVSMTDPDLLNSHVESHFNPQHSTGSAFVENSFPSDKLIPRKILQGSGQKDGVDSGSRESKVPVTDISRSAISPASSNTMGSRDAKNPATRDVTQSGSTNSSRASSSRENFSYQRQYEQNLERAVVNGQLSVPGYHEQLRSMKQHDLKGVDDGSTRVSDSGCRSLLESDKSQCRKEYRNSQLTKYSGLIVKLETLYRAQARLGQSAILCSPTDHYSASYGDKGWGCGYRNFQMLLSCLATLPEYAARIFPDQQKEIPSIPKIQEVIEEAWQQGFDPQGCLQLNGKLINTKKWIGATEIVATLSYLGIKCLLAEFHNPSSDDGTHPRLLQWVSDYFKKGQTQGLCRAPLYLQHQGHSRTIVGVEYDKGTTKLLLFDPGTPKDQLVRGSLSWKDLRAFRRTQAGFRAKQYQIVAVVGLLTADERKESKILKSQRVS